MKIVPVIVWYNPQKITGRGAIDNIKTYSSYFENIIIIDNSECNNKHLLEMIDNASYYPNYENLGIAKALNIGC
jgi:hypothetical protein